MVGAQLYQGRDGIFLVFAGFDQIVRIALLPSSGSVELCISSPLGVLLPSECSPQFCRGLLWRMAVVAAHIQLTVLFGGDAILLGDLISGSVCVDWGAGRFSWCLSH